MKEGKLIVFVGVEKAGKSTQIEFLAKHLQGVDVKFIMTKEPRGEIREELNYGDASPERELDLFLRDRASHFGNFILPVLERGKWVLSDRGSPCTFAYQHYGRGMELSDIKRRDTIARQGRSYDLIVLLDVDPRVSMARAERKTNFEKENWEFHDSVRQGYLTQAKEDPEHWLVVDGSKSKEEVADLIWRETQKRFLQK